MLKGGKMKFSAIIISLILLMGLFTVGFVVAEETSDSDDILEESDVMSSDELEVLEEDEVEDELPEYDDDLEDIEESERENIFKLTHVTIGTGFVMKSDESDAQFFRGTWVVRRLIPKTENLEEIEKANIESKKFGFVVIGVAEEKEKFRIEMAEFTETNVKFDVKDKTGTIVGSLEITPKKYERITLWFGTLTLDSGSYAGSWSVTAATKTRMIKPRIRRPPRWNLFAFKQRREAEIQERAQERIFEREGLGEFARENKGKDFREITKEKRRSRVDKKGRVRERIEARTRFRENHLEVGEDSETEDD